MLEGRGGVILKERQLKTLAKMERSNYDAVLKLKFFFNVSSTTPPTPLHASSCSCRNLRGQWGLSWRELGTVASKIPATVASVRVV